MSADRERHVASEKVLALCKAAAKVRGGAWIEGAPTHVLAELLLALERDGWVLASSRTVPEPQMSDAAVADCERALEKLHGPDQGGDNTLRRLNEAAFVGERYGRALVADWRSMRATLVASPTPERSATDMEGDWRCWGCGTTDPQAHTADCDPASRSYTLGQIEVAGSSTPEADEEIAECSQRDVVEAIRALMVSGQMDNPAFAILCNLRDALLTRDAAARVPGETDGTWFDDAVLAMEEAAGKLLHSSEDQSSHFYESLLRAALAVSVPKETTG